MYLPTDLWATLYTFDEQKNLKVKKPVSVSNDGVCKEVGEGFKITFIIVVCDD